MNNLAPLLYEQSSPEVARLVLNRPERSNAFSPELLEALAAALDELQTRRDLRVVLLAATGKNFCGGLDLGIAAQSEENAGRLSELVVRCLSRLRQLPQVVIAAAQGAARAGGAALLAVSDLVVADETFHLAFPEIHRGLDPILLFPVLRRRLSVSALSELLLTGQSIDVKRAVQLGLVHQAAPVGRALEYAEVWADEICRSAPDALRTAKELILAHETTAAGCPLEVELAQTLESHLISWRSPSAREGVAAFLEKRPPVFGP